MSDLTNKKWEGMPDQAFLKLLGDFVKHNRLLQNKTQEQLAEEAAINRTTLVDFEQGKNSNTITFIQILRVLNQLEMLKPFEVQKQQSPLQIAKLEIKQRRRARKTKEDKEKPKSEW